MNTIEVDRIAGKLMATRTPDPISQARAEGVGDLLAVEVLRGRFTTAELEYIARRWVELRGVTL